MVAAADAPAGQDAAVAFADRSGRVWAARVPPTAAPYAAAGREGQLDAREVQVAVTERGEIVAVWAAIIGRSGPSAVRYAVGAPGRAFSESRTLATVGSNTARARASRRCAAGPSRSSSATRARPAAVGGYARAPRGRSAAARSLGHDGVSPQIQASPGGGALLAWARGPLTRRALEVSSAQRGAPLPRAGVVRRRPGARHHARGLGRRDGLGRLDAARRWAGHRLCARVPAPSTAGRSARSGRWGPSPTARRTSRWARPGACSWPGTSAVLAMAATVGLASAQGTGTALGSARHLRRRRLQPDLADPRAQSSTPLVLFTRQIASTTGERAEVAAANPATGVILALIIMLTSTKQLICALAALVAAAAASSAEEAHTVVASESTKATAAAPALRSSAAARGSELAPMTLVQASPATAQPPAAVVPAQPAATAPTSPTVSQTTNATTERSCKVAESACVNFKVTTSARSCVSSPARPRSTWS